MSSLKDYTANLINNESCFDLQFRRDIRYERRNQPTYYRWKAQFVITLGENDIKPLNKVKNILNCGEIHFVKNQIRYSVQNIDDLYDLIVSFLEKQELSGNKKKDFTLWSEAIGIIYKNKGKSLAIWKKKDFQRLIDIHKSMQKYKTKKQMGLKWISIAGSIAKTLQS